MTWKLIHNNETVGEWSEDIIEKMAEKLRKLSESHGTIVQNEALDVIAELLPDPIRDTLSG
jgi:predicted nuclease of restriction endonuclease-like RecB superfamily